MPESRLDPVLPDTPAPSAGPRPGPARSPWGSGGGDRSQVKTFVLAVGLMALIGVGVMAVQPGVARMLQRKFGPPPTAAELRARVNECEREADLACAQQAWTDYLALRPDDGVALANLGMVMNRRDDHAHAVLEFKKAIDGGEGTYDLFGVCRQPGAPGPQRRGDRLVVQGAGDRAAPGGRARQAGQAVDGARPALRGAVLAREL